MYAMAPVRNVVAGAATWAHQRWCLPACTASQQQQQQQQQLEPRAERSREHPGNVLAATSAHHRQAVRTTQALPYAEINGKQ
jgi:hypothetical protein